MKINVHFRAKMQCFGIVSTLSWWRMNRQAVYVLKKLEMSPLLMFYALFIVDQNSYVFAQFGTTSVRSQNSPHLWHPGAQEHSEHQIYSLFGLQVKRKLPEVQSSFNERHISWSYLLLFPYLGVPNISRYSMYIKDNKPIFIFCIQNNFSVHIPIPILNRMIIPYDDIIFHCS